MKVSSKGFTRFMMSVFFSLGVAGCAQDSASPSPSSTTTTTPPATVASSAVWFVPDGTTLDPVQTAALFSGGQLYVNVQSQAYGSGEIRGEIASASEYQTDNGDPLAPNPSNTPVTFSTILDGDHVKPRTVITGARGYGSVVFDPKNKTISGFIATSGISGSSARIHDGLPGSEGSAVLTLEGGPVVWTVPPGTLLSDTQIARLTAGAYYFTVASSAFPGGEIRGQLDQVVRCASLTGAGEAPPVVSTASGNGFLALKRSAREITGFVRLAGVGSQITSVFLQAAPAGVNGPPIITLENRGDGIWAIPAGRTLTDVLVASYDNDELYFNVHTVSNLGGEIRGHALKSSVLVGKAILDGSREAPPVVSSGSGTGTFAFNRLTGQMSGDLTTNKVAGTAVLLQTGTPIATGALVAAMSASSPVKTAPRPNISFALDIQPIFTAHCSSILCHVTGGIAPMSLQPGLAYDNTVRLVVPGNSSASYFMQRLTGAITPQMPLAGAPLDATSLGMIRTWIDNGAPNN